MNCEECGDKIGLGGKRGRRPRFCSNACKQRAYRRRKATARIPERLTLLDRWARADGKRPIQPNGQPASTTNPNTWTNYQAVTQSVAGNGYGFMLGDGVVCIDIDHAFTADGNLTPTAQAVVATAPGSWIERSVSGTGLHIFGAGFERKGRKVMASDGTGVEVYARERFIRMTGETYQPGVLAVLDLDAALGAAKR